MNDIEKIGGGGFLIELIGKCGNNSLINPPTFYGNIDIRAFSISTLGPGTEDYRLFHSREFLQNSNNLFQILLPQAKIHQFTLDSNRVRMADSAGK